MSITKLSGGRFVAGKDSSDKFPTYANDTNGGFLLFNDTANTRTSITLVGSASAGTNSPAAIFFGNSDSTDTANLQRAASIKVLRNTNNQSADLVFETNNSGTIAERMRIASTGAVTFAGDVTFSGSVSGVTASAANTEINYVLFPSSIGTGGGQWTKTGTTGAGTNSPTTTSTAGDLPLGGVISTAIQMITGASNGAEASHYTSCTFTTAAAGGGKVKLEFSMRPGSNFANGEWAVSVYQSTTRQSLSTDASGVTYLPNMTGKFSTTFDALASTTYTLRFARVSGSTAATLNVTNVIVGPGIQPQGAVVGGWQSYTPTGGATNATYTGKYRRIGSSIEIAVDVAFISAPGGAFTFTSAQILNGLNLTVDSAGFPNFSDTVQPTGTWAAIDSGTSIAYSGNVNYSSPDATIYLVYGTNSVASPTAPISFGAGDNIAVKLSLPIAEWAGSGTVNLAQNDVEYAYSVATTTAASTVDSNTANYRYGPTGTTFNSINSTTADSTTAYYVGFQRPIQVGDAIDLEVTMDGGVTWQTDGAAFTTLQVMKQSTSNYGMWLNPVNSTTVTVNFGNKGRNAANATYAGDGGTWAGAASDPLKKWRVRKSSAGAAVGFGIADTTSSGLVPSGTYNKSTSAWTLGPATGAAQHFIRGDGTSAYTLDIQATNAAATNGLSNGLAIHAGITSGDTPFFITNRAGTSQFALCNGLGAWTLGDSTNAAFPGNNIVGRKDGSTIASGYVGEEAGLTQATGVTWGTSGSTKTVTSRTFTAGIWLIWGDVEFAFGSAFTATGGTDNNLVISNLSTTVDSYVNTSRGYAKVGAFAVASSIAARSDVKPTVYRFSSTTTVYINGTVYYSAATGGTMNGSINGVRIA